ncbi:MAG: Lrp/AsnC family transcriptional regulator [Amylibacter sp.]|nr:Lrp/AsnC family transcriptional regulator [Amylibacter sp.]|tara:strand:+ start:2928 stop:3386 length:459 start_codon:yes stop_codon:yes gene_type:complete
MKIIDEIDRKILRVLQRNASVGVDALADLVNLSRNACWRRMKNLEASGVIARRVAILDPKAVGLGTTVFVIVRTNQHDEEWLKLFDSAVRELPEIVGAYRMSGDLDYILRVRIEGVNEYDAFYKRLIKRVPLSYISASFVMDEIKDTTELPI